MITIVKTVFRVTALFQANQQPPTEKQINDQGFLPKEETTAAVSRT